MPPPLLRYVNFQKRVWLVEGPGTKMRVEFQVMQFTVLQTELLSSDTYNLKA
ncbi:hypothetical protein DPMN_015822 [Dreissena polymorpha]|uniref:Uncharacterized protein n=1 Tax=Dreissena polymorpha TaxID=45954 RepID=A0A9D4NC84_DREPO|nr:hypothetical protein DPMN_015806 [Dreissena polymorpha]KAH3891716.1 hypothetical protein DPMN_015822 [Dreissena polymorpha]